LVAGSASANTRTRSRGGGLFIGTSVFFITIPPNPSLEHAGRTIGAIRHCIDDVVSAFAKSWPPRLPSARVRNTQPAATASTSPAADPAGWRSQNRIVDHIAGSRIIKQLVPTVRRHPNAFTAPSIFLRLGPATQERTNNSAASARRLCRESIVESPSVHDTPSVAFYINPSFQPAFAPLRTWFITLYFTNHYFLPIRLSAGPPLSLASIVGFLFLECYAPLRLILSPQVSVTRSLQAPRIGPTA